MIGYIYEQMLLSQIIIIRPTRQPTAGHHSAHSWRLPRYRTPLSSIFSSPPSVPGTCSVERPVARWRHDIRTSGHRIIIRQRVTKIIFFSHGDYLYSGSAVYSLVNDIIWYPQKNLPHYTWPEMVVIKLMLYLCTLISRSYTAVHMSSADNSWHPFTRTRNHQPTNKNNTF